MAPARLVLFDIDGTLLRTQRAGIRAMLEAGRALFGARFHLDGIEFAGRIDPAIWAEAAAANGLDPGPANHARFRAAYGERLAVKLAAERSAHLMPGVAALVPRLAARTDLALGLLTGNYPETGRLKIRHAGLDPNLFAVCAWGSDGAARRDLPPVAMARHRERYRRPLAPAEVVIIGDTPHDVDCARHHGCRALAVATGNFPLEALAACGPDLALADLADGAALERWLAR